MSAAMEADTVLGGVKAQRAAPRPLDGGGAIPEDRLAEQVALRGHNPLVRAAYRLVGFVPKIRALAQLEDPSALRRQLGMEMRLFEQTALAANVPHEEVIGARYCLCTVLDETAAQTPWGCNGVWAKHSLLVSFHNETWGGEKYYKLLGRLAQNPERHRNLIELLYYCNALGFEGRFRVVSNGQSQLEALKGRIAVMLNKTRGGYERRLSPHWEGVAVDAPAWRFLPPWVVAALCALVACAIYFWFLFALGAKSDLVYGELVALRLPRAAPAEVPLAPAPPPPRVRRFLEPEVRAGLLEVSDLADRSVVTLMGDGLFESGSAEVKARYVPVLARVAAALGEVEGAVVVHGYTDDVPMRSPRFPSNWHLSQARAESVKGVLEGFLMRSDRVRAEGRGEANPVASNDRPEGRARNRRVEITVLLPAAEIHRQLNFPKADARPAMEGAPR